MNIVDQIKISKLEKYEEVSDVSIENNAIEPNEEMLNKLYNSITAYFEKEKSFCDPDFTISQLAADVNSNITYVSKAIKLNKDVNFNTFINSYRIDMVKDMLNHDLQNRYTMRHIYTSSGFRHQSTFNKIFKQHSGVTPSEYIKNLELGRKK